MTPVTAGHIRHPFHARWPPPRPTGTYVHLRSAAPAGASDLAVPGLGATMSLTACASGGDEWVPLTRLRRRR